MMSTVTARDVRVLLRLTLSKNCCFTYLERTNSLKICIWIRLRTVAGENRPKRIDFWCHGQMLVAACHVFKSLLHTCIPARTNEKNDFQNLAEN